MVLQINVIDAWEMLRNNSKSILIDVRTKEEIDFVGFVDLSQINAKLILLPWRTYPDMAIEGAFSNSLSVTISKIFPRFSPNEIDLLFLCRSGSRSFEAANAMSVFGYNCYNILDGFEGSLNSSSHRGCVNGWKANNLPWKQN